MSSGARRYFYNSKLWNNVRKNVWLKQNLLCSVCGKPVYVDGISDYLPKEKRRTGIVHHKIWLDNNNLDDDNVTINENNLIGVCFACHSAIHSGTGVTRKEVQFDDEGNLIPREQTLKNHTQISCK